MLGNRPFLTARQELGSSKGAKFLTQSGRSLTQYLSQLLQKLGLRPAGPKSRGVPGQKPAPVYKRVSLIIHNPTVPSEGGRKLNRVLGWNDPDRLSETYIADLREVSDGYLNYEIVERIEVDKFPVKQDGFVYQADDFVRAWRRRSGFHQPDAVDYDALLAEFDMIAKIDSSEVDEFWLFAFPYAGYYESIMGGPGAFWCNAPPLAQTAHASKRFVIMGLNYERGVGEMLEAFGHRAESIMSHTFRHKRGNDNLYERFIRHEFKNPGRAEVGWMHFAPNSVRDYDWGNKTPVLSRCHTWYNFSNLQGEPRMVDCSEWGDGDIREHHKWWFRHLPRITGSAGGISYNWWEYIADPNRVR